MPVISVPMVGIELRETYFFKTVRSDNNWFYGKVLSLGASVLGMSVTLKRLMEANNSIDRK